MWIIEIAELTDDLHSERFLRFDKFPIEQIDQDIALSRMERVLAQLNDRAASLRRLRVLIFHPESLRCECSRRHQEFERAEDRHGRIKCTVQLWIVSRLLIDAVHELSGLSRNI